MRRITYSSNNSGGRWWLDDDDWINLEKAGWTVLWGGYRFCHSKWATKKDPVCATEVECNGHGAFSSIKDMKAKDKWLGSYAHEAYIDTDCTMKEVIDKWESITGQNSEDQGCRCCGEPHNFYQKEL